MRSNEITATGYVNQRAVLARRTDRVEVLFRDDPCVQVVRFGSVRKMYTSNILGPNCKARVTESWEL